MVLHGLLFTSGLSLGIIFVPILSLSLFPSLFPSLSPSLPPSSGLRHLQLSERVTVGKDGNLYFSHVTSEDSREDYTCNVQYLAARTILPKEPITLTVLTCECAVRSPQNTHAAISIATPFSSWLRLSLNALACCYRMTV